MNDDFTETILFIYGITLLIGKNGNGRRDEVSYRNDGKEKKLQHEIIVTTKHIRSITHNAIIMLTHPLNDYFHKRQKK